LLLPAAEPIINKTKLPSIVPVFRGYPVEIVCEADGYPTPSIRWNISTTDIVYSETLTITESTPEDLYCIANNSAGITIRRVKVVLKGNYACLCIFWCTFPTGACSITSKYGKCWELKKNQAEHFLKIIIIMFSSH